MIIFKKEFSINYFLVFSIFIFLMMFFLRKIAIYLLLVFLTAVFTYINYHIKFPFDISPVLFLSLVISKEYNLLFSILFIFLSGVLPMIFAGGSFDHTTIFYLSIIFLVNFLNTKFIFFDKITTFFILIFIHHIFAFLGSLLFGNDLKKEFINLVLKIIIDFNYVFLFGNHLIDLIK